MFDSSRQRQVFHCRLLLLWAAWCSASKRLAGGLRAASLSREVPKGLRVKSIIAHLQLHSKVAITRMKKKIQRLWRELKNKCQNKLTAHHALNIHSINATGNNHGLLWDWKQEEKTRKRLNFSCPHKTPGHKSGPRHHRRRPKPHRWALCFCAQTVASLLHTQGSLSEYSSANEGLLADHIRPALEDT